MEELHASELAPADVTLDLLLEQGALFTVVVGKSPAQFGHACRVIELAFPTAAGP